MHLRAAPAPRRRARTILLAAALALTCAAAPAGCGSDDGSGTTTSAPDVPESTAATTTADDPAEVVADVLGEVQDPPGAQGQTLTLIRYTIPPGAQLSPHIHPGVQVAHIESGELSYTIEEGIATIQRADDTTDEFAAGPTSTTLGPGDTVTETDGMVHFGANDTDEPIVIVATLLTPNGSDLAVVTTPG